MGFFLEFVSKFKSWITWTWAYLWLLWFILVLLLFYILKGPLKLTENVTTATMFFNTLTPKFYVALTGTSSLISGLILVFEWWYFKKYGTSFIEQVSLNYIMASNGSDAVGGHDGDFNLSNTPNSGEETLSSQGNGLLSNTSSLSTTNQTWVILVIFHFDESNF